MDNYLGSSFTMRTNDYHTGGTSGANFAPPTGGPVTAIGTNHSDIGFLTNSGSITHAVSKLYVFDKAVEVRIKCQVVMSIIQPPF